MSGDDTVFDAALEGCYESLEDGELAGNYHERHGVNSACILTVYDDELAAGVTEHLAARITGKVVIEVGGGIGLLGCHLATVAERVYCIEAEPAWAWTFTRLLYQRKPANLSYLFGAAQQFIGLLRGHVALFCTHSDAAGMRAIAAEFAPEVIDVYGELVCRNPLAALRDIDRNGHGLEHTLEHRGGEASGGTG